MRKQFLELIRKFSQVDVTKEPRFIVVTEFHKALVKRGFSDELASLAAGSLEIDIEQNFIDDKDLFDETIKIFADSVMKIKTEFDKVSPTLFREIIKQPGLKLEYK